MCPPKKNMPANKDTVRCSFFLLYSRMLMFSVIRLPTENAEALLACLLYTSLV